MHSRRCPLLHRQGLTTSGSIPVRTPQIALLLGTMLIGMAGCGRDSAARDAAPAAGTAQPVASAVQASAGTAMPVPVEAVGRLGEDAYDLVKSGDWTRARAVTDSLTSAVRELTPAPGADAPSPAEVLAGVQALDHAVTAHDRTTGLREANHLTELGASLAAGYHPRVPTEVALLDYYGRELEIWSDAKDLGKLSSTTSAFRRTWNALRPRVEAHGGATEASEFAALVTRAEAATTPAAYAGLATPILDAVDKLERVFTR